MYAYDRRSSFERRSHLHYEGVDEDAAFIASEVIRKGKSHGWVVEGDEDKIAQEIEVVLAKYNIGYVGGAWVHHVGGTRHFQKHLSEPAGGESL